MKIFTHSMIVAMGLVGAQGAAWAQDDDTGGGGDMGMGGETTTTSTEPTPAPMAGGGGYAGLHSGLEGVTVPLFASDFGALVSALASLGGGATSTSVPTANFIWGLNESAAIDTQVGIILDHDPGDPTAMPATGASTRFGIAIGAGYRMIKTMKGKIRPWVEPGIRIADGDVAHTGDVIAIGVFAELGFEYLISDQLTIGTHIGAEADFSNKFKKDVIATNTGAVDLGFWW
jgi:hypothetical protein